MKNSQLIDQVKIRRALWDTEDLEELSEIEKYVLWLEITDHLQSTKSIVKTLWKYLKDYYRKL